MPILLDTHYHLDFLPDSVRAEFVRAASAQGVQVVAQTLTPSSFTTGTALSKRWASEGVHEPLWSLGFHPWCITSAAQAEAELEVFAASLDRTRFIGEIGLDFSPRGLAYAPADVQRHVLREVLRLAAASDSPRVLSIHAVRSASEVIASLRDMSDSLGHVAPVFHRFSGTSDDLTALMRLGGYVSVGRPLLASKRGRAYVTQVPADRILLETDLPTRPSTADAGAASADEAAQALRGTLAQLALLRGQDLTTQVLATQNRLYGVDSPQAKGG